MNVTPRPSVLLASLRPLETSEVGYGTGLPTAAVLCGPHLTDTHQGQVRPTQDRYLSIPPSFISYLRLPAAQAACNEMMLIALISEGRDKPVRKRRSSFFCFH